MKLQLLSDLHLETESFQPVPAAGAELLVLAGDIDARWRGLARFAQWPVPVLFVPGNHEFDGRAFEGVLPALRTHCAALGIRLLQRDAVVIADRSGRSVRFLGVVRWSDYDAFGTTARARSMRAAAYFQRAMGATVRGLPFDAEAVRAAGLADRAWLEAALAQPAHGRWQRTVVITHFAPSLRSADPRFGRQPSTASFCNADDDLIPRADLWLHGHLHCRHDYRIARLGREAARVVCRARGLAGKGEVEGLDPLLPIEV